MIRAIVVCAAIAALGIGVGCGGEDGSLTKAEMINQGDQICARAERQKASALEKAFAGSAKNSGGVPSKAEQEDLVIEVALPPVQEMVRELDALDPPSGDEEKVKEIVLAFESALQRFEANPAVALAKSEQILAKPNKLAGQYGFKVCSKA